MKIEADIMNLLSLKEKLLNAGKSIALQVDEETQNSISLHSQIVAKDYFDDSIYLRIVIFSSGTLHMFFTFNEIERTYDNLYLINNFNAESPWFKAYIANINDKDYLELHYVALAIKDEEGVVDTIGFLMNELLNEETTVLLRQILDGDN